MPEWIIYRSLRPPGRAARWCKIHGDCNPLVTVTTELLLQRKETGRNTSYPGPGNWIGDVFILGLEPGSLRDRWQLTHLACSTPSPSEEGKESCFPCSANVIYIVRWKWLSAGSGLSTFPAGESRDPPRSRSQPGDSWMSPGNGRQEPLQPHKAFQ